MTRIVKGPSCAAVVALAVAFASCSRPESSMPAVEYPATLQGDVVEDYHGTSVSDPYRWMEDLDSRAVAEWVAQENAVTDPYLAALPLRVRLQNRLTTLWNFERTGLPTIENGRLFYSRNTGLQRQSPVYVRDAPDAPPALALDPNVISEDGSLSMAQYSPSPDGRLLAYGLSEGGADWRTLHVRDVASGDDLDDEVRWMRFSPISWTKDSGGFFYSRYPEPPANKVLEAALSGHTVYYHRVGRPQSEDLVVYQRPDLSAWIINAVVTEDGRYLLILMAEGAGNRNRVYLADLGDPAAPDVTALVRPLIEADDAEYFPIGNVGPVLYLRSDKDAPKRKVIALDVRDPAPATWRTVVPEQPEALENVALIGGQIVAQYLVDVQSRLELRGLDGSEQGEVTLPGVGTVAGIAGRGDSPDIWYRFTSPLSPTTVYRYDPATRRSTAFEPPSVPVDLSEFETTAMFATSRDGTRVPFFMTARRNLPRTGDNPTMITGYGGFSVSTTPTYRVDVPAWLELGGVWVTVSMRGGAEYGEAWHEAGMLGNKQNVFDDFIAVAESLIRDGVTSPERLGAMGGSNGGLLVGAVVNQRPDLYAVALPAAGVMDMLRYDHFTGGRLWATEYGSASDPDQFPFLMAYSPVHNVRPDTCYPATLVTTADHDDRVVPSHSFKYVATMQSAQACENPVLIRVEVEGSHGYRPTDRLIAERADIWAFAAEAMGVR